MNTINTITINSPSENSPYHIHVVTLNRIITKIRFELNKREMVGYSESVIYSSLDLFFLLSESKLFKFSSFGLRPHRISEDPELVGYLFSNSVYLDWQLQGLEFHFNDRTAVRKNKINSILEDTTLDKLTTYKIEIERDLMKQI